MPDVRRRELIALLGGAAAAAWPVAVRAQQPTPIVSFVNLGSPAASAPRVAAFQKGLSETGYVESQNVTIEYYWLDGRFDRLPSLMADLVRRRAPLLRRPVRPLLLRPPKQRPRRSRLSSASAKTPSSLVWSQALPGRAAM
jgi:hypothetical protein